MIFNDFSSLIITSVKFASYYLLTLFITGLSFYTVEMRLLSFVRGKAQNKGGLLRQELTAEFFYSLENLVARFAPRQYEQALPPGFYKVTKFKILCFFVALTWFSPGWHHLLIENLPDYSQLESLSDSAGKIYALIENNLKTIVVAAGASATLALIFFRPLYKFKVKYQAKRETDKSNYAKADLALRKINKNLRPLRFDFEKNIETFYRQTKDIKAFVERLRGDRDRFVLPFAPSPFEQMCAEYRSSAETFDKLLEVDKQIDDDCVEDEFFELSKSFRREFFCLGFGRIGNRKSLETTFLDQAYMRSLFQAWKESILENSFDEAQAERDIKWSVEHILSEALEEKIRLRKLIKKQDSYIADGLLARIAAALPG
jgi:hypothetical protein